MDTPQKDPALMEFEDLKQMAHSLKMECIPGDGDEICIRPMLFDDEGIRITRHYPDPCEFTHSNIKSALKALAELQRQ